MLPIHWNIRLNNRNQVSLITNCILCSFHIKKAFGLQYFVFVCMNMYVWICMYEYVCICVYEYVCMYMYACNIYIYMHVWSGILGRVFKTIIPVFRFGPNEAVKKAFFLVQAACLLHRGPEFKFYAVVCVVVNLLNWRYKLLYSFH